ncbi:MAG TPA: Mur ligase family protein [Solirubrobacteraceae bacterium]|jgi:UDP-N-acetylmuramyl tripeptide synthase|nr:Mur ligase family protein [Solirubrobacteraceae bacterium]
MSVLLAPKLALARAVGRASRRLGDRRVHGVQLGGGGTSLPGKLLMALQPDAISLLGGRLARGCALISATNGKTTTAALAASVLERSGLRLVHNQAGANMAGGIASTLLAAARSGGRIDGELGLFEVDELWLDRLLPELCPSAVLLGNLFRDQLDRYGELDTIAERWGRALGTPAAARARLVCNADDPLVADLGRDPHADGGETLYFGIQDDSLALERMAHAADAKHCRRCGSPYAFEAVYLGHLGHYRCESCGQSRPSPAVFATDVRLEGVRAARFRLHTPAGQGEVALALPGLYNVYNALAAAALCTALEVPLEQIVAGLQGTAAAFGRGETVRIGRRPARILLVKNPAGANEVLRTLALEDGEHELLGVLNDRTADGHDVSWIWDADFELLRDRLRRAVCSGTRAAELALRLKYAGVPTERIEVIEPLDRALQSAAEGSDRRDLYILPTYTAMLELRELLVRRGEARSSWL